MSQELTKRDEPALYSKALEIQRNNLLELAPMAVRALRLALRAKSERVRVDAAKSILAAVGLSSAPESHRNANATLAEVPIGELRRLADRLEGELAARAKPIKDANLAPIEAEILDETKE